MKTLWLAAIVTVLFAAPSRADDKQVAFNGADGFALKGTFYSVGKAGPGILLLHQCNADRRIYDDLATMLVAAGYNVLAFDFRGFGETKGQRSDEQMPRDVDAAIDFLISQPTVNKRALGVVGGSCGVNQAVQAGRRHPEIRTLVLLSGGTDAAGEAYVRSSPHIPILGAASEEDTTAAAATKKIVGLSTHRDSRVDMLKDAGHAASMFAKEPELQAEIVIWFRSNLPPGGYGLPPAVK
jgi:pimeloyl-ACP methyl ester carboxylesterase